MQKAALISNEIKTFRNICLKEKHSFFSVTAKPINTVNVQADVQNIKQNFMHPSDLYIYNYLPPQSMLQHLPTMTYFRGIHSKRDAIHPSVVRLHNNL